jgi:hypothetical protein
MSENFSGDDDIVINPYEAPHYVEGEPEPLRQVNGAEILIFGVNALFSIIFILAFLVLIIRPETSDQRLGGLLCIIPLVTCTVLEFAAILSLRTWVRRVLGIADIVFGALFTFVLFLDVMTSDKTNPAVVADQTALGMAILIGMYFVVCGAYRLYRIKHGAVVPVAMPVEGRENKTSTSKVG